MKRDEWDTSIVRIKSELERKGKEDEPGHGTAGHRLCVVVDDG